MPRVTRTVPENNELMERLGAGIANVSGSNALFAAVQRRNVLPNTATFIIGVGGSGCQTVDAIKHKFVSEFQNWQNAVAFLAMDTAGNELNNLPTLDDNEKYLIPLEDGADGRWINEAGRSDFARTWVNPEFNVRMRNEGAGQIRQVGKARLYDRGWDYNPNDNRIINKLNHVFTNVLGGAIDRALNIIIILGTAGGTGFTSRRKWILSQGQSAYRTSAFQE